MRILILGGTGLLGHMVWRQARRRGVDAVVTLRTTAAQSPAPDLWESPAVVEGFDARDGASLGAILDQVRPSAIVNCIGITKARVPDAGEENVRLVNSVFPHAAAAAARERDVHLIHISTDCVFQGETGAYTEAHTPDADDLYGRSKADGEPSGPHVLTLRTSIIGRELAGSAGLLEWFLSQRGQRVPGFRQVRFSGVTTPVLADCLIDLAARSRPLTGLYHVAADPIDKCALLDLVGRTFDAGVGIDAQDTPRCDRTLDGRAFRAATGFMAPPWPSMIGGLRADAAVYHAWRLPT